MDSLLLTHSALSQLQKTEQQYEQEIETYKQRCQQRIKERDQAINNYKQSIKQRRLSEENAFELVQRQGAEIQLLEDALIQTQMELQVEIERTEKRDDEFTEMANNASREQCKMIAMTKEIEQCRQTIFDLEKQIKTDLAKSKQDLEALDDTKKKELDKSQKELMASQGLVKNLQAQNSELTKTIEKLKLEVAAATSKPVDTSVDAAPVAVTPVA